jgi:hypothetical protein
MLAHLQGCSPRLYRLRTDGLAYTSKYLTFIIASMAVLGEKLSGGPVDHSARLGLCREPFFSGAVGSVQRC